MTSGGLKEKFLEFFKSRGHEIVASSSLIPSDSSVLFTTAGMQQFKPYYTGEKSPYGDSAASAQKCLRVSDFESIGDESHLSFFEMLGNFSFGGYFKKEAIEYAYEFITKELGLEIDYVSVFAGDEKTPADGDSEKIWKQISPDIKIKKAGREDNFWGPTGNEGPCGPTTEIYINGVEIWNLVFNEYYRDSAGKFSKLKTPGVDTGMGLERLLTAVQKKNNVFETDLFEPIMREIIKAGAGEYSAESARAFRIIADHIKAGAFILSEGVEPSNVGRGYVLRRLIRRAVRYGKQLGIKDIFTSGISRAVFDIYGENYPELNRRKNFIEAQLAAEEEKFLKTLENGLKEFEKLKENKISGKEAFNLYQTYGFPFEMTKELAKERGIDVDEKDFENELKAHQELSRTASAGMFKSGLADHSEQAVKYHTASHLLLAALRKILGQHVSQKGSNITSERLRFDFSHQEKMTSEQIKQAEDLVNEKIKEDLAVEMEEMSLDEAKKQGAAGVFEHKYGEKVKVYTIGDFSKEICGGPHVAKTGELGHFKITREESSSAGVRRIKAILE